jgi:hypothetical protein
MEFPVVVIPITLVILMEFPVVVIPIILVILIRK